MNSNNFLFIALFISLSIHTTFIVGSFLFQGHEPVKKKLQHRGVEITYTPRKRTAVDIQQTPIKPSQQLDLKNELSASADGTIPVKLVKDNQALPANFSLYERRTEKVRSLEMSRRVSIVPIKSEKMNNPAYTAYYEMVRSRIEEKVNENYDRIGAGNIYLTFVVDAQGNLKAAQIIAEKTDAPQHLQDNALKSLKEASPFPVFFKGMSLPEYTFNIEVLYKVHD